MLGSLPLVQLSCLGALFGYWEECVVGRWGVVHAGVDGRVVCLDVDMLF
jgi:hypothetical protein